MRKLFVIVLTVCISANCVFAQVVLDAISHTTLPVDKNAPKTQDEAFLRYCDSLKTIHDSPENMGRVLCANFPGLPYHAFKQNKETDFIVNAVFKVGDSYLMQQYGQHADMAILNYGGIRTGFPAGKLTYGHLFDVLCFDNYIVVQQFKGRELKKVFDRFNVIQGDSLSDQPCANVQISYHKENTGKEVFIGGEPIENERLYWVVSLDFILGPSLGDHIFEGTKPASEMEFVKPVEPLREKMVPFLSGE